MNINGSICKSVSDKWELFDSERDMANFGDENFVLESLDNKQNALHLQENWYPGHNIAKIR